MNRVQFTSRTNDILMEFRVVKRILAGCFAAAFLLVAHAANAAPTVILNEPSATGNFVAPADVQMSAYVNPAPGDTYYGYYTVSYYSGTTLVGTAVREPYSTIWHDAPAGTHTITATATDDLGNVATSASKQITVKPNLPPTVSMQSVLPYTDDIVPAWMTLKATAVDPEGNVFMDVTYYANGVLIGSANTGWSSYSANWYVTTPGTYSVVAHAKDGKGSETISAPMTVVIKPNILPVVSLVTPIKNGAPLTAEASDADGTIFRVDFRIDGNYQGTVWKPPYTFKNWSVGVGSYQITASTTDNKGGVTVSTPVNLTVYPNVAPTASVAGPANNATFVFPATIALKATAADSDGTVDHVDFYQDGVLLGTSTTAPYSYSWVPSAAGTYRITVRSTDELGMSSSMSAPVSVTVNANVAPAVSMTAPLANVRYAALGTFVLAANATDSDGTIVKVDFYNGAVPVGTDRSAPYTASWTNVAPGTYSLSAKATDDKGAVTTSAALAVTVITAPLPTVSISGPANNSRYIAPATFTLTANTAISGDTISKVDYISGPNLVGTATAAPYAATLANIGTGTYTVSAKATGALGGTSMSAPITLVVNPNSLPLVTFEATPANAAAPAVISMNATATDSDGSIVKVEFFNGATRLATVTQAPYTYLWNGVGINSYQLTARATDNLGGVTTSIARTVTVTAPRASTQAFYIYNDQINTAREITNGAGAVVWQADPDPFGANLPNENPTGQGQFTYNQRFPGQYYDRETGLHYNYYRDYDPQTGRYVQSDPIGLGGGVNTYAYGLAQPLTKSDRLGLSVTATLDRKNALLTVVDNDTNRVIIVPAFTGGQSDIMSGKIWYGLDDAQVPLPAGEYNIVSNMNPKSGHEDWYSIIAADGRMDDYFYENGKKRAGARLHKGTLSHGCVTVNRGDWNDTSNWNDVTDMLGETKTGTIDVIYGPWIWSPSKSTKMYGKLFVR